MLNQQEEEAVEQQGRPKHSRESSCSSIRESSSPARATTSIPRVWLDADPSGYVWTGLDCDDDLAILVALALHEQEKLQLEGISICGGNAPLAHTWKDAQLLLQHAGYDSRLTPHKGYGWRSMQFSRKWLQWFNLLHPDIANSNDAAEAIIRASKSNNKLTVLTLGPPTNVAKALELDPTLASRIDHIYMMGGELTNQNLDLNFASDRAAARTDVDANIPTTLIPIQLCAQIIMEYFFVESVERDCCPPRSGKGEATAGKADTKNIAKGSAAAACSLLPKNETPSPSHAPMGQSQPSLKKCLFRDDGIPVLIWNVASFHGILSQS
jgi:hypothetical protein